MRNLRNRKQPRNSTKKKQQLKQKKEEKQSIQIFVDQYLQQPMEETDISYPLSMILPENLGYLS